MCFVFLMIRYEAMAGEDCRYPNRDLDFYRSKANDNDFMKIPQTKVIFDFSSVANHIDVRVNRALFQEQNLKVEYESAKYAVSSLFSTDSEYIAFIIPPGASELSQKILLPPASKKTTDMKLWKNGLYPLSSLGDGGAIVLLKKIALMSCSIDLNPIYFIPKDANNVSKELFNSILLVPSSQFADLVYQLMLANSDYKATGASLLELLKKKVEYINPKVRRSMFQAANVFFKNNQSNDNSSNDVLSLPVRQTYQTVVDRIVYPDSFARVTDELAALATFSFQKESPFGRRFNKGVANETEIDAFMNLVEHRIRNVEAVIYSADEDLKLIEKRISKEDNEHVRIKSHHELDVFKFNLVTLQGLRNRLRQKYELLYGKMNEQPPVFQKGGFDGASYMQSSLEDDALSCKLKTQAIRTEDITIMMMGKQIKIPSSFYVIYRSFNDPVLDKVLYRAHFILASDVSNIDNVYGEFAKSNTPTSSCRHKYTPIGGVKTYAFQGQLLGNYDLRYEKWMCENFDFICWDWGPKKCQKHIKTKLFTLERKYKMSLTAHVRNEYELNVDMKSDVGNFYSKLDLREIGSSELLYDTLNLKWNSFSFQHRIDGGSIVLSGFGKGKAMRAATACSIHGDFSKL
jgi:hypothetical protein